MPLDNTHKTDHFKSSIQTQEKCHVLNGKKEKPGHIQRGHKKNFNSSHHCIEDILKRYIKSFIYSPCMHCITQFGIIRVHEDN